MKKVYACTLRARSGLLRREEILVEKSSIGLVLGEITWPGRVNWEEWELIGVNLVGEFVVFSAAEEYEKLEMPMGRIEPLDLGDLKTSAPIKPPEIVEDGWYDRLFGDLPILVPVIWVLLFLMFGWAWWFWVLPVM